MAGNVVFSSWISRVACVGVCAAVAAGSALVPARIVAQQVAGLTAPPMRDVSRVSVDIDAMSMVNAINAIAREAGLVPVYDATLFPSQRRVTMHLRDVPVRDAFARALSGTRLVAQFHSERQVVIVAGDSVTVVAEAVTGTVINAKTKQPIARASITLDDTKQTVVTGEDGTYRMLVPAGQHVLHVRAIGMGKQAKAVSVETGRQLVVDVALDPTASVLDEVIVTGTVVATERKTIPTPITVITAAELERRGITRIEQLFRGQVAGLLSLDQGVIRYSVGGNGDQLGGMQNFNVFSRGSSSLSGDANPIKIYIDGVELLNSANLGAIDPSSIERIEIVTGPQAATIYGSGAMGGVMQIFTKRSAGAGAAVLTASIKYGMLESNMSKGNTPSHLDQLSVTGGAGPAFSYSASATYTYQGQWQPDLFNRQYAASAGATHTRGPLTVAGTINVNAGQNGVSRGGSIVYGIGLYSSASSMIDKKRTEDGTFAPNTYIANIQRISEASGQTLSLNVDHRTSASWTQHATIGRAQTNYNLRPEAATYRIPSDSLLQSSFSNGSRTTASYNTTFLPSLGDVWSSTLTVGANGSWADQSTIQGCLATDVSTTYLGCTSAGVNVTKSLNTDSWGGFTSWQIGLLQRLYLTLGVRAERNPSYGESHRIDWTPTNGLAYTMEHGDLTVKVLGSYGRATRAPDAMYRLARVSTSTVYDVGQWTSVLAAPELRPEYDRGPQGGIELYYGNLGSLTINHYRQMVTDLIQQAKVDSIPAIYLPTGEQVYLGVAQYQNVAKIRKVGWEGTASVNAGPLTLNGTYSWNDSRVVYANWAGFTETGFTGLPTHTGNVTASYARGGTTIAWSTNYIGATTNSSGFSDVTILGLYSRLRMYVDNRQNRFYDVTTPGYVKSDLTALHRLSSWATATLNITNIGNSFTSDFTTNFPTLGRQTLIGITMRYPR